jgi:hypothetical protein
MAQYPQKQIDISLALLFEIVDALKGYRDDVVLVGGWAPYFVLKRFADSAEQEHVGSLDADLALNFRRIPEDAYETILQTIERNGYSQRTNAAGKPIPASFQKTVNVDGIPYTMQLDFLAGEYGGKAKSHRHQHVQEILAHKARGADLVFDQHYTEDVEGTLLNGARITVRLNFANEVAIFAMKGICIGERSKSKDFYDLYMLAKHFKDGPTALAEQLAPHAKNPLLQEAIANIKRYFRMPEDFGPTSVADFLGEDDSESREILRRDAFEVVTAVLAQLATNAT